MGVVLAVGFVVRTVGSFGGTTCGASFALCQSDEQRFGRNVARLSLPERPQPVILGAVDCHIERAVYSGDRIAGWEKIVEIPGWVPLVTVCTSESLESSANVVRFHACAAEMGAGTECVHELAYRSSDSIRWTGNGDPIVAPLPSLLHSSAAFDAAHTSAAPRQFDGVTLPAGTEVLDPVEAGRGLSEATLPGTTTILGAPFAGTLSFDGGVLVAGTLARPASIERVPCRGRLDFTSGHLARCTLAAPYHAGSIRYPAGTSLSFDGPPHKSETTASGIVAQPQAAPLLLGRRLPANSTIAVQGRRVRIDITADDGWHVSGAPCAWLNTLRFDGTRTVATGRTAFAKNASGESQAETCSRTFPSGALTF